jgi:ribonuclease D
VEAAELNTGVRVSKPFSSGPLRSTETLRITEGDLSPQDYNLLRDGGILYVDTETDGLDFRRDRLRLVTVMDSSGGNVVLVRNPDHRSYLLKELLGGPQVKIFHHAPFDVRFLVWWTGLEFGWSGTILCTKALCKFTTPDKSSSLHKVLPETLKVTAFKDHAITTSNWNVKELTPEQITYAVTDVFHLGKLAAKLGNLLGKNLELYYDTTNAIIKGAIAEVHGFGDALTYEGQPNKKLRKLWDKREQAFKRRD